MKLKNYQEKEVGTGEITKEYADKIFEELLAFQGYGFCLGYDSEVEVKDVGKIPIGKLKGGEYIKAPALGIDYKWVKVINIIPMGKKKVCKLYLGKDTEIICTDDHKFLCSDNRKHSIIEIIKNNYNADETNDLWIYCEKEYKPISEIKYLEEKIPVMDITVDSEEHLFYANGIAVSNCAAHAKAYSIYSAVQLWLQEHYFLEYMCVLLSHIDRAKEKKGIAILNERVEYCIKHGVTIHYPDVNNSNDKWQIVAGGLLAPLKNIKSISDRELNIITQNRPYKDLKDFLDKTQFNNKRFEVLLFAHAFDKFGKIEDLYNWYYNNYINKDKEKKKEKDLFDEFGFEEENESSYAEANIVTFSKVELDEKCLDLNGFVVSDNILIKYHDIYKKKIGDLIDAEKESKIGRSKIYQLEDLYKMEKGESSEAVWALAQVKNTAVNLKTKKGKPFSKATLSDGITKLDIFIWRDYLPSYIKKGNVLVLPFKVFTDPDIKENKISFAEWMADKCDIPIIEEVN